MTALPPDPLRIAMIGLGRGAVLTVPAFAAHPRVLLAGGFDPAPDAVAGFVTRHGGRAYARFEDVIADPDIEAVYIASPHEHHAAQTISAAQAGKHVLVEKPMAVTLAEAGAMAAAADTAGTVLIVGPSHGYDPPVALAAALIASGEAGRPRFIQAFNHTDFLYRPRRAAELDPELGGGVVLSQATHQIDIVRRLAGSSVTRVRAWTGSGDPARGPVGAYSALLSFANGCAASLTYAGHGRFDSDALAGWAGELGRVKPPDAHARTHAALALGETAAKRARGFAGGGALPPATHHERFGFVLAQCARCDIELVPDGVVLHGDAGPVPHRVPLPAVPRLGVVDAFVTAVRDGTACDFTAAWGLHTLAVCHAILRSGAEAREVDVADHPSV